MRRVNGAWQILINNHQTAGNSGGTPAFGQYTSALLIIEIVQDTFNDIVVGAFRYRRKEISCNFLAPVRQTCVIQTSGCGQDLGLFEQDACRFWSPLQDLDQKPAATTSQVDNLLETGKFICRRDGGISASNMRAMARSNRR